MLAFPGTAQLPKYFENNRWISDCGIAGALVCPGLSRIYAPKGCLTALRCSVAVAAVGRPATARSMASFVAL
jgi:hypothetical protein